MEIFNSNKLILKFWLKNQLKSLLIIYDNFERLLIKIVKIYLYINYHSIIGQKIEIIFEIVVFYFFDLL
jgi:hypothetical protein